MKSRETDEYFSWKHKYSITGIELEREALNSNGNSSSADKSRLKELPGYPSSRRRLAGQAREVWTLKRKKKGSWGVVEACSYCTACPRVASRRGVYDGDSPDAVCVVSAAGILRCVSFFCASSLCVFFFLWRAYAHTHTHLCALDLPCAAEGLKYIFCSSKLNFMHFVGYRCNSSPFVRHVHFLLYSALEYNFN